MTRKLLARTRLKPGGSRVFSDGVLAIVITFVLT
jgi:hypothetical protein